MGADARPGSDTPAVTDPGTLAGLTAPAGSETRLLEQIDWYDRAGRKAQRWFKRLKVAQLILAAFIPVAAGTKVPEWLVGIAGALIVVLEGIQQLQQYQQNWTTYRSTCERLKHERYLYEAGAGPYGRTHRPAALLAERVEGLVSQEHAAWTAHQEEAAHRRQAAAT